MPEVTIRQRNQLTVPAEIARQVGIQPGTTCTIEVVGGVITLTPTGGPAGQPLAAYRGAARGAWGPTPAEIEATIAADRASWQR